MDDQARLIAAVDTLNQLLPAITPYKLAVVDPALVEHVEKNAHYMSKKVFDQLVANIAQDGNLESLPFCWRRPDGVFVCLSGNHRLDAARAAKLSAILVLYTDAEMSRSEAIAKQLAHNAITGKDNAVVLQELWKEIDTVQFKVYSGLDESYFHTLEAVKVQRFNSAVLRFEELRLQFVTSELTRIDEVVKQMGSLTAHKYVGRVDDFDRFFDVLLAFKEQTNTYNTSTAFLMMIEICAEWLEQNAKEHAAKGAQGDPTVDNEQKNGRGTERVTP